MTPMTIIVYRDGVLIADSRIIDDERTNPEASERDKLIVDPAGMFAFAYTGVTMTNYEKAYVVQILRRVLASGPERKDKPTIGATFKEEDAKWMSYENRYYFVITRKRGYQVLKSGHLYPHEECEHYAHGSGRTYAHTAMTFGATALEAAHIAWRYSTSSGGHLLTIERKHLKPFKTPKVI